MLPYEDRIVEHPNRVKLVPVAGTTDEFDLIAVPGKITKIGRAMNQIFFDSIKEDFDGIEEEFLSTYRNIPQGLICMWSGSIVPTGWLLCNGENGTPDLRDRFIVGAGNAYSIGDAGGEKEHKLTEEEMPSHKHTLSWEAEASGSSSYTIKTLGVNEESLMNFEKRVSGESIESIDVGTAGSGQPHENRPPYYALAFIMKA